MTPASVTTFPHPEEKALHAAIAGCRACPRLVRWREQIGREKVRRYREEAYWASGVPSFGSLEARLLVVGLAPAAHGANRTGRMFTGDRSGDWLYEALFRYGFANQPVSTHAGDGLTLIDCRITAVAHCAPPENRLTPAEIRNCGSFLSREIAAMTGLRLVVALGRTAFEEIVRHHFRVRPPCSFSHGAELRDEAGRYVVASYHPSQQNTFTKRLTRPMFHSIFRRARHIIAT